jgi:hypothetical protein
MNNLLTMQIAYHVTYFRGFNELSFVYNEKADDAGFTDAEPQDRTSALSVGEPILSRKYSG